MQTPEQACGPTTAPGRIITFNNSEVAIVSQPGDILYIMASAWTSQGQVWDSIETSWLARGDILYIMASAWTAYYTLG